MMGLSMTTYTKHSILDYTVPGGRQEGGKTHQMVQCGVRLPELQLGIPLHIKQLQANAEYERRRNSRFM